MRLTHCKVASPIHIFHTIHHFPPPPICIPLLNSHSFPQPSPSTDRPTRLTPTLALVQLTMIDLQCFLVRHNLRRHLSCQRLRTHPHHLVILRCIPGCPQRYQVVKTHPPHGSEKANRHTLTTTLSVKIPRGTAGRCTQHTCNNRRIQSRTRTSDILPRHILCMLITNNSP